MRVLQASLIFLITISAIGNAKACTPPFPSEAFAKDGRGVIIGKVDGGGFLQRRVDAVPEMLIKIERLEILSGHAPSIVTAVVPCAIPLAQGERVVVATFYGRRYVYPADIYEESFRSALRRKR